MDTITPLTQVESVTAIRKALIERPIVSRSLGSSDVLEDAYIPLTSYIAMVKALREQGYALVKVTNPRTGEPIPQPLV